MLAFCDGCASWTAVEPTDDGGGAGPVRRCSDCRSDTEDPLAAVRSMVPI